MRSTMAIGTGRRRQPFARYRQAMRCLLRPVLLSALRPGAALRGSAAYRTAVGALGDVPPSLLVSVAPILELARGLGAGASPQFGRVRDVAARIGVAAAGGQRDGEVTRGRLVLGLR